MAITPIFEKAEKGWMWQPMPVSARTQMASLGYRLKVQEKGKTADFQTP